MATNPLQAESAPTNPRYFVTLPGIPLAFSNDDREKLASFVEIAVAFLDAIDGNPDIELNGDELDGTGGEDDFVEYNAPYSMRGPGCPIADPDTCVDDEGEGIDEREADYAEYDSGEVIHGGGSGPH